MRAIAYALALLCASLSIIPAEAQTAPQPVTPTPNVVANCGTPNSTYTAGKYQPETQNTAGQGCISISASQVGGYDFFVSTTPTIQNAQYVSGNCMGGFQAVAVGTTAGLSGIFNKLTLISKGGLLTAKQIYVFTSNPSASTCTDRGTFTIGAADALKWIATFSLIPAVPTGGAFSEAEASNRVDNFVTSGNANLYFAIVETATETPASVSDLVFNVGGIKDQP